eukprot:CAMPEP_0203871766 /NCGR_PEP_ID=MMETSP0359-20131031/18904_1 /ASSEMBLY_ACC=CAM_ASM_000338 /TAXON_ID=268821 /ORGANISM="Scrippsiella Hangoei, Strain SHTV-5" /LENGTH=196 /DNA_ID=CAMNT_0050790441 /DNA_START=143 /DNA_END=730 /DNA_ORIENTATION=+
MSRGVPVRITTGIEAQHNRVAFMRAMGVYGEVVYCRKPPYSGIPGEDYVNIGFASQSAAERAYEELKAGRVIVDGIIVGCGQPRGVPVKQPTTAEAEGRGHAAAATTGAKAAAKATAAKATAARAVSSSSATTSEVRARGPSLGRLRRNAAAAAAAAVGGGRREVGAAAAGGASARGVGPAPVGAGELDGMGCDVV